MPELSTHIPDHRDDTQPPPPRSDRPRGVRIGRLAAIRTRRGIRRLYGRLLLFSGWTWVAAASLIGIEGLEIAFGAAVLVPEFIPIIVMALALAWFSRRWWLKFSRSARIRTRAWAVRLRER